MRLEHAKLEAGKGWHLGPWNADLPISIGFATEGVDEPHVHSLVREVYLVARGWSEVRIESTTLRLHIGDVLVVEPGEPHTFLANSEDYLHFVVHTPGVQGEVARTEKQLVSRSALGLP